MYELYIIQETNGNAHICQRMENGNYKVIGFVAGDNNLKNVMQMVKIANYGETHS